MFNDENDYELLYLISESNEEAKEMFFEKYRSTVELIASKYFNFVKGKGFELNDLIQEGMIGLNQAIYDFREQKNIQFNTFASICIERQIKTFVRDITRNKHKLLNESISMDSTTDNFGRLLRDVVTDGEISNPEYSFIDEEEENELKKELKKVLTAKEYSVFLLRLRGFTYQDISEVLNISKKSVDGTLSRIKIKINNIKK